MGKNRPRPQETMVFSTQSTHKLLAGLSQASHVLAQDSVTRSLDRHLFNEAYLMHTSTSPQYAIIASCDVAAAMMEPPGGTALVEESICEAMDFRRAMRKVSKEYGENDWWFKVWGPDTLPEEGIGEREDWILRSDAEWHGFGKLSTNFNMLDPVKATRQQIDFVRQLHDRDALLPRERRSRGGRRWHPARRASSAPMRVCCCRTSNATGRRSSA